MCCSVKRLTYGYDKPIACFRHRKSDMTLIALSCQDECVVKTLNYNFPGLKYGVRCNKHKQPGMIDITKYEMEEKDPAPPVGPIGQNIPDGGFWPKDQPSDWLLARCHLSFIDNPKYHHAVTALPFIYDHVGGSGKTTPPRGVCTVGGNDKVRRTWWTASQNRSDVTLESKTLAYPQAIATVIPELIDQLRQHFPDAPISDDTFSLAVANHYQVGTQNKIAPHTDDQPWYASPPVFASITTFPEGEPDDYRGTFRFQVWDEGLDPPQFIDLYLRHSSVCIMRADIIHRVLPPLSKFLPHRPRHNLTFRNIVSSKSDPLGYILAMSNHYRYYGLPNKLLIPEDAVRPEDLIQRYQNLNPDLKIMLTPPEDKKRLRQEVMALYSERGLQLNLEMLAKSNVTSACLKWALQR